MFPSPSIPLLALLFALPLVSGCSEESRAAGDAPPGEVPTAGGARRDPRLDDARRAIEEGLPDAAWILLDQVGELGIETGLYRARACLSEADAVGALRELEAVRALAEDPKASEEWVGEFHATEVEILAALDRLESARELLKRSYAAVGKLAVLERARGVLLLRTPGAGLEALAALEGAAARQPGLPFLAFPLAQARLLVGRGLLAEDPEGALALARLALDHDPANPDFRELEAEALSGRMFFEEALAIYESLETEGRSFRDTRALLHQKLATRLLLQGERDRAADHYVEARGLGLDDEGLGFGVEVLRAKSEEWIDAGIRAFEEARLAPAADAFEKALRLSPESLEARNHLGVVRFRLEDHRGAALAWQRVLEQARRDRVELPDPVHMNLARAWRLAGERERAREVLSSYLDDEPAGAWAEATREMLAQLELEELRPR